MAKAKNAVSLGISALIVIALILVLGTAAFLGALSGTSSTETVTRSSSTTTTTTSPSQIVISPTNAESTNSTLGLQLSLTLNSTIIQPGQVINVSSSVFNTLSSVNNVTGASDWALPASELRDGYSCPSSWNVQLFSGYYSQSNISSAGVPLQIDTPVFPPPECPATQYPHYLFYPLSSVANVPLLPAGFNTSLAFRESLSGYYDNASLTSFNACVDTHYPPGTTVEPCIAGPPAPFPLGEYTVAADDEWGQLVILHFSVNAIFYNQSGSTSDSSVTETVSQVSCSKTYSNGTSIGVNLYIPENSGNSVSLCVRFFSYNPNGTTINTLDQMTIFAPVLTSGTLSNANSSFSITASTPQIQIGGPQMENEGFPVTYTITTTGSTPSGTYEIALSSGLYPEDVICGYGIYVTLQVGNITNPTVMTSCHYIPAPEDNPGLVYSEIAGVTNST